jgi:hypothetical protein
MFFLLRTNHKPLEWFTTISNAYKEKGRWISLLQDFHFKIIHHASAKHSNVDALSKNLVGRCEANEDLDSEIQDLGGTSQEIPKPHIVNKDEIVINLSIVMEVDARNCNEEVLEKGKELVLCHDEKQKKHETNKGEVNL